MPSLEPGIAAAREVKIAGFGCGRLLEMEAEAR